MNIYREYFLKGLKPDPILTVSEWADEHRMLSRKSSAEPGNWRTSRTPYLKEIMDCLSVTSMVEEIIFMKSAQIGGTECINNMVGYVVHHAPGPMLLVNPTVELAKRNSKQRLQPLIDESPVLSDLVKEPRARDSGNTVLAKEFPGGILVMTGANSAVGLRSLPAKYLLLDEIDAFPGDIDGEGDPVELARKRTSTFSKRKICKVSTPTIEGRSRIETAFMDSDQSYYFVPCPRCAHMQNLVWGQLRWPEDKPLQAKYICESCEGEIENWEKTKMLEAGEWRSLNDEHDNPKVRGFHINALYSPVGWIGWGELARDWVNAKGNNEKLKTFINTTLGETWKDRGDAPDWRRLYDRREPYERNTLPLGVVMITIGCDVQKDRLELEIVGWGRNKRSWSIDYRVFMGDTSNIGDDCWKMLGNVVDETWMSTGGVEVPVSIMGIDAGYNTNTVYSFCRKYPISKVIATKGLDTATVLIGQPKSVDVTTRGKKMRGGMKSFTIGVSVAKMELYGWLKQDQPIEDEPEPFGFCHFPEYETEFFKMMCAEELTIRWVKARKRIEWEKIRDRNEALDCRVIARCAASLKGLDRFREEQWNRLENEVGFFQKAAKTNENVQKSEGKKPKRELIRRKSNFL